MNHRPMPDRAARPAMRKPIPAMLALATLVLSPALAAADPAARDSGAASGEEAGEPAGNASSVELDPVRIIGSTDAARDIPGGATVISERELERFEHTDIQRTLRRVPGVSVQVEDGFGLRPNLSIRGTPTDRSRAVTLLEDGVPIAPAPYAAPSAYYFPTTGRLQGIEVLKGPAAVLEGPYTTGGAINLISTRIPDGARGLATLEAGSHGHLRGHAWYGDSKERYGYVLEAHEWRSNGFQDIDRSSRDTGLNKSDFMARFRVNTPREGDSYHALELKLHYADETSNQSYLGLTDADFRAERNRRYGLSELDQMNTEHQQAILSYTGRFGDTLEVKASAYYNDYERAWFKTEGFDFDGSPNAQRFERTGWLDVIQAINRDQPLGGLSPAELQAILDGEADTPTGSIELRNNAREYYSRGLQGEALVRFASGPLDHNLRIGMRLHQDEEDRLQRQSTYSQVNGTLALDDFGLLGNAGNRVEQAEALAVWLHDRIDAGRLGVSPGVRLETMQLSRVRYETRPERTDDPSRRADDNLRSTRDNNVTVLLPGIGIDYNLSDALKLVGGVHKGFSAPSSDPDTREEESVNYEFGFRYNQNALSVEVLGFWNDFENLVGVCTVSSGADCEVGEVFSGDAARVRGIETRIQADLSPPGGIGLPFEATWTYSDAEFRSDLADSNFFGDALKGDPVPYIPEHQFHVSQGVQWDRWQGFVSLRHVTSVCTFASCGPFEQTDALTSVDMAVHYDLTAKLQVYALGRNLNGEDGIAGRQPRGARPNLDRTFIGGIRVRL